MTTLFLFLIAVFIIAITAQENLCLWGRNGLNNRFLNGLYRKGPQQVNNNDYYKLDRLGQGCNSDYYWLFKIEEAPNHGWYIGMSSSAEFSFGLHSLLIAKCRGTNLTSPVTCGNNWVFFDPDSSGLPPNENWPLDQIDGNFTSNWGRCPQLDCESLTITSNGLTSHGICYSTTATQDGANVYVALSNSWVWWFNEPSFQWLCTTPAGVGHTCNDLQSPELKNVAPVQQWFDLSDGETAVYHDATDWTGSIGEFTCSGTKTTTTFLPTTPFPSVPDMPTPYPTYINTQPPFQSTLNPSENPSESPSEAPTAEPTVEPTGDPSNAPSKTPSAMPTMSPSENPVEEAAKTTEPGYSGASYIALAVNVAIAICLYLAI